MEYAARKGYYPILLTYQPLTTKTTGESHEIGNGYEIYRVGWFGTGLFHKFEKYFPLEFLYLFPGLFVKSFFYYLKNHDQTYCIHAHGFAAAAITRVLCMFYKKRSVVSTHAIYALEKRPLLRFLVKLILNPFNKILAVSEVSKQELISIGMDKNEVEVHKNWVNTDSFIPKDRTVSKSFLKIKENFNLLFIGRLMEKKGINLFLECAGKLPSYGFHVVGTGPSEEEVKKSAEKHKNIHFYGVLRQHVKEEFEKLLALYGACDYTVSPYLYDEGFSAILVESEACGTPVIVTNRGSPPTFLDPTVAYYLSANPTSTELASVLIKLESERPFDKEKCRSFALKNFGFKNADTIIDSYEP